MRPTTNYIGNKIIRLTRYCANIDNIRSTFPSSTRLSIFIAAGFRSTWYFVFFPWHNTMKQSLCEFTVGFLLRSFHNVSVEIVSHTTWRLSLRGGRPLLGTLHVRKWRRKTTKYTQSTNYKFSKNVTEASTAVCHCGLQ